MFPVFDFDFSSWFVKMKAVIIIIFIIIITALFIVDN